MTILSEVLGLRVPKPWALKAAGAVTCDNPDLMIGVELEVENCQHSNDWYIDNVNKLGWAVEVDNSLRGTNVNTGGNNGITRPAFEFISKPMKSSTLLYSLEQFLAVTKFDEGNYTDRCSVHVHANCGDLTVDQISAIALVYTVVEEILFRFVGENRENNIYCMPWRQCRMHHDMVSKLASNPHDTARRWQKYTALNLLPLTTQGTVEFRHMHGTADLKKLTTWINLIGSIFKYGAGTELTALIGEIKSLNSTSEYKVFFERVLGGNLPYEEDYRTSLESGIITAKFGLVNWKKEKKSATLTYDLETAPPAQFQAQEFLGAWNAPPAAAPAQWNPTPRRNRFNPWPANGQLVDLRLTRLNTGERLTLGQARHNGLWNSNGNFITIIGQPVDTAPAVRAPNPTLLQQIQNQAVRAQVIAMDEVGRYDFPPPAPDEDEF